MFTENRASRRSRGCGQCGQAVVPSTGNVGIAYSAYSALAGSKLWAFVTSLVPREKMREMAIYGTEVVKVTGTYDQTKRVTAQFAERQGLFRDRGIRSFAACESMKTVLSRRGRDGQDVDRRREGAPGKLHRDNPGER